MRFALKKVTSFQARLGCICEIQRLPEVVFETPLLLLYTKGGSIPHITYEVLQYITKDPCPILIPLPKTVHMTDALQEYKDGITKFAGLQGFVSWCTIQDPAEKTPNGYNTKSEISVWTNAGRLLLSTEKFMTAMEAMQCDVFDSLCDADYPPECGEKRKRKSVEVSDLMLERCISSLKTKKDGCMLASIVGGLDIVYREKSAKNVSKQAAENDRIIGYSLTGLHSNGLSAESTSTRELLDAVNTSLNTVGTSGVRTAYGCWTPDQVLSLAECGIDVFDSSFPYLSTQRKAALSFKYSSSEDERIPVERPSSYYEFYLNEKKHEECFGPLVEGCECLTCQKHTKAYIHHLVSVNELLASTLLMIHNLHHYLEFFKFIRKSYSSDLRVVIT